MSPTETASPSCTQSIDATAMRGAGARPPDVGRAGGSHGSSRRRSNRSCPRDFAGQSVRRIMNNGRMDVRRLRMLLELSRLGSMHEVADALGTTTSTRLAGDRRAGPRGRQPAARARRQAGAADAGRTAAGRPRRHDPRRRRGRAARPRPDRGAGRRGARRRVRDRDQEVAAAGDRRAALDPPSHRGAHPRVRAARGRSTCSPATTSTSRSSTTTTSRRRSGATTTSSPRCGTWSGGSACRRATGTWRSPTSPTATGS